MQSIVAPLISLLSSNKCAEEITSGLITVECSRNIVSKCVGLGIIVGASLVKLPQIRRIMVAKSVAGISLISYSLETLAFSISLAYNSRRNAPFASYGESALILVQNIFILTLILKYSKKSIMPLIFAIPLIALFFIQCDVKTLALFQWGSLFIGIASKLPQIVVIHKSKSTGQLAVVTTFLQLLGSFARVGTTLNDAYDPAVLSSHISAFMLNLIIFVQFFIYKTAATKQVKKKNA